MRIEPLHPTEVADFLAWRGASDPGTYLDAAFDSQIRQHLEGSRFIFLAKEEAENEWIGTVSLALFHHDEELVDGQTRVYLQALEIISLWLRRGVGTKLTQHVVISPAKAVTKF